MSKKKRRWFGLLLVLVGLNVAVFFNATFYHTPLLKITQISSTKTWQEKNTPLEDALITQEITGIYLNGENKGQKATFKNSTSLSEGVTERFLKGQTLLIEGGKIKGLKRDSLLVFLGSLLLLVMMWISVKKAGKALLSLGLNFIWLLLGLTIYRAIPKLSLTATMLGLVLLMTVTAFILQVGWQKKTGLLIFSTLVSTYGAFFITVFFIWVTGGSGLHFEEMSFLTRPYQDVFYASVLLGGLGASMDVVVTCYAALEELLAKKSDLSPESLKKSLKIIAGDVLGTMANVLLLAYIAGSLPVILLYLRNGLSFFYVFPMNLSLELLRALSGAIALTLAVPITLKTYLIYVEKGGGKV